MSTKDFKTLMQNAPKQKELLADAKVQAVLDTAKGIWREESNRLFEQYGDSGSCSIGGGIKIMVRPPRCRQGRYVVFIEPPRQYQGDTCKWGGMRNAIKYIKQELPELEPYIIGSSGSMD